MDEKKFKVLASELAIIHRLLRITRKKSSQKGLGAHLGATTFFELVKILLFQYRYVANSNPVGTISK